MAATTLTFGPSSEQLTTWRPRYYPNAASVQSIQNTRRAESAGKAVGALYSSPLVFGSTDEYHDVNLDWFKVTREGEYNMPGTYPTFLADYGDPWTDSGLYTSSTTQAGGFRKNREKNVKIRTFAGQVEGLTIKSDYRKSNAPTRKTSNNLSKNILNSLVTTVNGEEDGQGLFAPLIPGAPNGFLISESYDYDVQYNGDPDTEEQERLVSTYWPERLGNNHPLRDIYEKFYGTGARFWQNGRDRAGTPISSGGSLSVNNPLQASGAKQRHDYSKRVDPVVFVGGPFSETELKFGNGNNIIVASPVMTAAFHRTIRSRTTSPLTTQHTVDDFHTDTVLYPSAVGQYGTNTLELGNGNNIVYYDSSYANIDVGKGNNVFIPSFGSFNWGINWIPAYGTTLSDGTEANPWGSTTKLDPDWLIKDKAAGLITPIPWDKTTINPFNGQEVTTKSYLSTNSKFAAAPKRGDVSNLYTINSYRRNPLQKTYLNYELLNDKSEETRLKTYNPVNKIGGTVIAANGGDNIFYGQDWSFWQHLLPSTGVTSANQLSDSNNPRAAQHQWNTMTLIGGRGNNTFNLGNVVDNITNNGLFLKGDASYRLSLSHDNIYTREEILQRGSNFGNNFDAVSGQPLMSVVNLQLQADPATLTVTLQDADPGQSGSTAAQRASAWGSVANVANKFVGNGAKIQEDVQKNWRSPLPDPNDPGKTIARPTWLSTSKTMARIVSSAVPFFDTAISIVSAVTGLINLFSSKPAKPPKQEIKATYLAQALDLADKAILINDWNPNTKININLPSVNSSEWKALKFEVKTPISESTNNTNKGAFLNLNKSAIAETASGALNTKNDFPLVVLENLDKGSSLDNGFGYYTYNFINPSNAGSEFQGYNFVSSANLRLFGQLPNPSKLFSEDGKTLLNPILFPQKFRDGTNYKYISDEGFDMRHDAANFSSFYDSSDKETNKGFYTRYYFNATSIIPSRMPSDWNIDSNLREFTSNISLEFDSRTLGWYWQPVLQTAASSDAMFNSEQQNLDLERSKLWIKDRTSGRWNATSFIDLNYNTKAYQDSLKATTFYVSSMNGEGRKEVEKRQQRDQQLSRLDTIMSDLRTLDQSLVRDERSRVYHLAQVETVTNQQAFAEGKTRDALVITFASVDDNDNEIKKQLLLYKNDTGSVKAAPIEPVAREFAETLAKLEQVVGTNFSRVSPDVDYFSGIGKENEFPSGVELKSFDQVSTVQFNGTPNELFSSIDITYTAAGQRHRATLVYKKGRSPFAQFPQWLSAYKGPVDPVAALLKEPDPELTNSGLHGEPLLAFGVTPSVDVTPYQPWDSFGISSTALPWVNQLQASALA